LAFAALGDVDQHAVVQAVTLGVGLLERDHGSLDPPGLPILGFDLDLAGLDLALGLEVSHERLAILVVGVELDEEERHDPGLDGSRHGFAYAALTHHALTSTIVGTDTVCR
jgi:hypothetical protein